MNLVIVESPTKAKTIAKFLDSTYDVVACFGHVRDLPSDELGVDVKNNYEPKYINVPRARKIIAEIKNKIKQSDKVYLATDYDREGEAIAWHIMQAISLKSQISNLKSQKYNRITFHEITKGAILEAIEKPREIDINLVDAQQARRILDRLVGYKLSPFLWRKVAQGLSAGRVQSVAVRLIVDKEREIKKFKPQEYWSVEALLEKDKKQFKAILAEKDGQKIDKLDIKNDSEAAIILNDLKNAQYKVNDIKDEQKKRYPSPPFTTSTLQQDAANKLSFSAKQTMRLAQNLYEQGLITYMRTDSLNVSPIAIKEVTKVIKDKYGKEYALEKPRFYKTKSKGAQEAHEAIRPTNFKVLPVGNTPQDRLYGLIWKRMVASQVKEAEVTESKVKIKAANFAFLATGTKVNFDGFLKVYNGLSAKQENILPELKVADMVNLEKLDKIQHFTEAPARFTEATLIKELEKRGIGRPSTYAPTLSTIVDRGYIIKEEGKLIPEEIGEIVNDVLVAHFPKIIDYDFTAKMEEELDDIAEGKLKWQTVLDEFYKPFSENLSTKSKEVTKQELTEMESEEKCPKCGKSLKYKLGRFGKFLACTGFPDCKYTQPILNKTKNGKISAENDLKVPQEKCEKCGKEMVLKEGRFGAFLACSGYPECKNTKNIEVSAGAPCPNCGGKLVQKNTKRRRVFWGCASYPKCKTAFWDEPIDKKCSTCGSIMLKTKTGKEKCSECK